MPPTTLARPYAPASAPSLAATVRTMRDGADRAAAALHRVEADPSALTSGTRAIVTGYAEAIETNARTCERLCIAYHYAVDTDPDAAPYLRGLCELRARYVAELVARSEKWARWGLTTEEAH